MIDKGDSTFAVVVQTTKIRRESVGCKCLAVVLFSDLHFARGPGC